MPGYRPRHPEQTTLYRVVARELEAHRAEQAANEHPVPQFVESELRAYLQCGILAHGFCRVHCAAHKDRLVAFKIVVQLKTRWRDGTSHLVLTPRQFMQRLVALVPAPRANLTRYHGVFAPNSKWRKQVVPPRPQEQLELWNPDATQPITQTPDATRSRAALSTRPDNYDWATLLRRVFEVDVTLCPDCGGPTKIISAGPSARGSRRI